MKYLKKFNELNSSTYLDASTKLNNFGHKKMAANLKDYGLKVADKEKIEMYVVQRGVWGIHGVSMGYGVWGRSSGTNKPKKAGYGTPMQPNRSL